MRSITIHKPTHKFFTAPGTLAIAIGQLRGSTLYLNRMKNGRVVEKTRAVESAAYHLTGYGKGVQSDDARGVESMQNAWLYVFGDEVPLATFCEVHQN